MAKITHTVLVVDIEATCWGPPAGAPSGMESDIIEVGVCLLSRKNADNQWRVGKSESIIVKPRHSTVSQFCTDLTSLTQADVNKGIDLFDACRHLETEYDSKHLPWCSWGDYDKLMFERNCRGYVRYPFGPTHWNMKDMYSLLTKLDKEVGMAEALRISGLTLEGTHHRGVDDARNVARILERILP